MICLVASCVVLGLLIALFAWCCLWLSGRFLGFIILLLVVNSVVLVYYFVVCFILGLGFIFCWILRITILLCFAL